MAKVPKIAKMSAEEMGVCSICQMTFSSHEEVLGHNCVQIKEEKPEIDEEKQLNFTREEDFKDEKASYVTSMFQSIEKNSKQYL